MPPNRPPTKAEVWAKVEHEYRGYWDEELIVVHSIEAYVAAYQRWVNEKGWRKPPEWVSGRVALHELRPAKAMFPEEARAWCRRLKLGYRERRASEAAV